MIQIEHLHTKNLFYYLLIIILSGSCSQNKEKNFTGNIPVDNIDLIYPDELPELNGGEYYFTEDDFGEIIELKGEPQIVEQIFKVTEIEMVVVDSQLIVKNRHNDYQFMAFMLPDFRYIKSFGIIGRGPGEFMFPRIAHAVNSSASFYIYDLSYNNLFSVNRNLDIEKLQVQLPKNQGGLTDKQIYAFSDSIFFYVESTNKGKSIYRSQIVYDSLITEVIHDLSFSKQHNNWAAYIGDFAVNEKMNRLVYAYKYFKQLIFIDPETNTTKTLIFDEKKARTGDAIDMLGPDNVTHYWGISAQKDYLYCLYSGRTPIVVSDELRKGQEYIFVEQFDWNGNPVRKFRLDFWGFFCVSEAENSIYVASTTKEDPFIRFTIPAN